jgi:hypothetical protein
METSVTKIQSFYRIYIKSDRDKATGLPIDPITLDPIPPKKQIRVLCVDLEKNKPVKTQCFHLDTLHTWFKTRGEAINPLTNIPFSENQKTQITRIYKQNKMKPLRCLLSPIQAPSESVTVLIIQLLHDCSKNPSDIETFTNLLISNYTEISSDRLNLDTLFKSRNYFLNNETLLMSCVLNDNLAGVEELLYYSPSINYADNRYDLKAIDLAMMSNKPMSGAILRTLLFHGAKTDLPTKKGYINELSNDIDKLQILYEFM